MKGKETEQAYWNQAELRCPLVAHSRRERLQQRSGHGIGDGFKILVELWRRVGLRD